MKAISLWQPWATAMAIGLKQIETRHWLPSHRGLLAIHAAKRWTREEREWAEVLAEAHGHPILANPPLGAVVATGFLVRAERTEAVEPRITSTEYEFGNYARGRYAWIFEDIVGLAEPVTCNGAQGFFELGEIVSQLVLEQTARSKQQVRPDQLDLTPPAT
jgi:hypothetical protein